MSYIICSEEEAVRIKDDGSTTKSHIRNAEQFQTQEEATECYQGLPIFMRKSMEIIEQQDIKNFIHEKREEGLSYGSIALMIKSEYPEYRGSKSPQALRSLHTTYKRQITVVPELPEVVSGDIIDNVKKPANDNILYWKEAAGKLIELNEQMHERKQTLSDELEQYKKEEQNLLHMIEFEEDEDKGFLYYKKLRQVREEKRQVKNELEILHEFTQQRLGGIGRHITNVVDGLQNKVYFVR